MTLRRFLSDAGRDGACVGVIVAQRLPTPPADFRTRTLDADAAPTMATLLDSLARAWQFPDHFGRNKDALDDCMRDLDSDVHGSPAAGYLTVIAHPEKLLREAPDELRWFADSLAFYRDHYRDVADPPATFAVLLHTDSSHRHEVENRWRDTGSPIAVIEA
ncbi:barstar family protein [Gordonia sp. NPDC003424]